VTRSCAKEDAANSLLCLLFLSSIQTMSAQTAQLTAVKKERLPETRRNSSGVSNVFAETTSRVLCTYFTPTTRIASFLTTSTTSLANQQTNNPRPIKNRDAGPFFFLPFFSRHFCLSLLRHCCISRRNLSVCGGWWMALLAAKR
jgi:hypothetical protein